MPHRRVSEEAPYLRQPPVQDGMDAHEARPVRVGGREGGQVRAVRVGAAGAHEDGVAGRVVRGQVVREGGGEGECLVVAEAGFWGRG